MPKETKAVVLTLTDNENGGVDTRIEYPEISDDEKTPDSYVFACALMNALEDPAFVKYVFNLWEDALDKEIAKEQNNVG